MFSIDHDLRSEFKSCPRKLFWSKLAGIGTKEVIENELNLEKLFYLMWNGKEVQEIVEEYDKEFSDFITDSDKNFIINTHKKILDLFPGIKERTWFNLSENTVDNNGEIYHKLPFFLNDDGTVTIHAAFTVSDEDKVIGGMKDIAKVDENFLYHLHKFMQENHKIDDERIIVKNIECAIINYDLITKEVIPYDEFRIETFGNLKEETNHVMRKMCEHVKDINSWPWNSQSCVKDGKCCDYLDLCLGKKNIRKNYKKTSDRSMDNDTTRKQFGLA